MSDNGPSYIAVDLADWLETRNAEHIRGAPCDPQTRGKIERWHQTLRNRILLQNYSLPGDLEVQVSAFVDPSREIIEPLHCDLDTNPICADRISQFRRPHLVARLNGNTDTNGGSPIAFRPPLLPLVICFRAGGCLLSSRRWWRHINRLADRRMPGTV